MKITDLKIRTKIMLAVLIAGLIGVGVSVFGSVQLQAVDQNYAALLGTMPKALLASARASRAGADLIGQTYKVIPYPLGSPRISQARAKGERAYHDTLTYLDEASAARAVMVFKQNGLSMLRLEMEKAEQEALASAEREAHEDERKRVEIDRVELARQPGTQHFRIIDLDPEALVKGRADHFSIAPVLGAIDQADGVIVATPIYKASCSGLMEVFLDLLPQYGLSNKAVLPLATGGSLAHVLAFDYAFRPILQSMRARHIVQGVFVSNGQSSVVDGAIVLEPGRSYCAARREK
ncbi:NAD(P)H-dependent oxidoreductase [Bosea sp. ASV33]|uniref:NAD(P)H-dependent oxidoreductase n=1 Tax=Bosea sp. ASV33 TaxID=2795106 RepID=UPI0020BF94B8|nr:NAD(P)H-dependent oxidoreductase [Bosea sp. ASV33]